MSGGQAVANPRVRKRDRIKRITHKQIERLMAKGGKTWMYVNNVLRHGKWKDPKDKEED